MALTQVPSGMMTSEFYANQYSNNLLINGSFEIWQRGTSVSNWGSFGYTADNVQIGYDGSPTSGRTVTRQTFATGQTDIPEGDPRYYLQYEFPNVGTPTNYLRFPVEGVRTLAGKQATFSFWARVPSGTMTIGTAIAQEFGSGGSPSGGVYPSQTNYTVTTTWQKFVYTTTLGSITGKTLGTNNNDMIWPAIWCPNNSAGTIQIANLKLEGGNIATPFQKRPVQLDLALCKRYFQLGGGLGACYQGGATATFTFQAKIEPQMRAAPSTVTIQNGTSAVVQNGRAYGNINSISLVINSTPQSVYMTVVSSDTGMTANASGEVSGQAIAFSSEL